MNRRLAVLSAITAIVVATVLLYFFFPRGRELGPPSQFENVGGKYNASISTWTGENSYAQIEYADESGTHSEMYFNLRMRSGLDWIRNNTPENATFLCWWEDGHMIKGYAERNVVVRNPSHEVLNSVANQAGVEEFDPHERILDVAEAFTTNDTAELFQTMQKYSATYVFVSVDFLNRGAACWLYDAASLNWSHYLFEQDSAWQFTEAGKQTMFARLIENRETGLELVYENEAMMVYRMD